MLKQLKLYYVLISMPFVFLIGGSIKFFPAIKMTLDRNPHPQINYTIFVIILVGGIIILLNSRRLVREARALVEFAKALHAKTDQTSLRKLANSYTCDIACMLQMIATSGDRAISHQEQAALEHELANVHSRLNRRNALPSYLTGLLVGMGLLGTFIGLLATLGDIGALIGSFADLDMSAADPIVVFGNMIEKMKAPMNSMAIAFSASMFGLLGSIILGLMMVGIRRLQGDIHSMLTSETARHIEIALSFESISFRPSDSSIGCYDESKDLTGKVLLRIEERLAEAARVRQRALSAEIDDFKKQRAEMMQVMATHIAANNSFQSELQKLGGQLGTIISHMEQRGSAVVDKLSDLTVRLTGDGKETQRLMAAQLEEQQRLAESQRSQQKMLATVVEDMESRRQAILQSFAAQTDAAREANGELQRIGAQLATIASSLDQGQGEISQQLSELTVHVGAEAKESQRLLSITGNNVRSELQQLGTKMVDGLAGLQSGAEQGQADLGGKLDKVTDAVAADAAATEKLLSSIFSAVEQGNGIAESRLAALVGQLETDAKSSQGTLVNANNSLKEELQLVGKQLGTIFGALEKARGEFSGQISEMMHRRTVDAQELHKLLSSVLPGSDTLSVSKQEG